MNKTFVYAIGAAAVEVGVSWALAAVVRRELAGTRSTGHAAPLPRPRAAQDPPGRGYRGQSWAWHRAAPLPV